MISIIICTFNRSKALERVLSQLCGQINGDKGLEMIVVDNNSQDDTRNTVERFSNHSPLRYILEKRQGKPFALNRAVKETHGEWLIFTDDDVRLSDNWLNRINTIVREDQYRCFFGKILPDWNGAMPAWFDPRMGSVIVQADHGDEVLHHKNYLVGANMGIHRSIFDKYGLFNETIERFEDAEFSMQVNKKEDIVYDPRPVVYHPIAENRLTKKYFRNWYREMGAIIDSRLMNEEKRKLFGAPRWAYRKYVENMLRSLFSFDQSDKFYHQLQIERVKAAIKALREQSE